MSFSLKIFWLMFLSIFISSCSPVYKITHDLDPPKTVSGLSCIRGCQSQLNQCNKQCSKNYKQCSVKAEQQAKKELPAILQSYPKKLESWLNAKEQYMQDLDWYEFRLDMAEAKRERYLDRCSNKSRRKYHCTNSFSYSHNFLLHDKPTFTTPRPIKPTLTNVTSNIRNLSCSKSCACNSKYRLCYSSCGGIVKSNKICIKNCSH